MKNKYFKYFPLHTIGNSFAANSSKISVEKDKLTSCIGHNYDADASGEDNHGDDDSPADGLVR